MLQFGHDSSPWMTLAGRGEVHVVFEASIRPRLIAVDDMAFKYSWTVVSLLQFGHDSSPWMTQGRHPRGDAAGPVLQFGHDSSPWMTPVGRLHLTPRGLGFNSATTHRRG